MGSHLGELEHQVLLALLRLGAESYSVPVVLELERRAEREVAPAAVYIVLRRLENKGLLRSRLEIDRSGRQRRLFALRPGAYARLRASRRALLALWAGCEELLEERS